MKQPYAYLRKSRVFRDKDVVSPEMQLAQVTDLAARHGDSGLVVLTDMNLSGRKANRPGFQELLRAIGAGEVSAIYSYSLSRLSRSIKSIVELAELCQQQAVPIRLARDIDPDPTTASGRLMMNLLAAMAQFEGDVASERARDTVEARRARGDKLGPAFFQDVTSVVEAYEIARSIAGTARLLNLRGVPSRSGKPWQVSSVRSILVREAPEILPAEASRGASKAAPFMFARLLRCECGKLLTGVRFRSGKQAGYVLYRCLMGRVLPYHGPQSVPETVVLEWAKAAAEDLDLDGPAMIGEDSEARRSALLDRKRLANKALMNGMDEAEYDELIASVDDELARLDVAGRLVSLGSVRWDVEPALVNDQLRAMWREILMDGRQRPLAADWRVPHRLSRTPG